MLVQQLCQISENRPINEHAYSLTLHVGKDMTSGIEPGQFLHIKCGDGFLLRRPISVCQWTEDTIQVVYEVRGEGTRWLSKRFPGERLDVLGPLGNGFNLSGDHILLVGGGIGVPPLLSCGTLAKEKGKTVYAAFGFQNLGHQMLTGSFAPHCKALSVISNDGTTGRKGLVTDLVTERLNETPEIDSILVCGPHKMIQAVSTIAESHNIPCQISIEERMGCGVGACLVCACKTSDGTMKHVCKDGPVFPSKEVIWDD